MLDLGPSAAGGSGTPGRVTLVLATFFAGVGGCLVLDLVTDPRAPGWRVTGLLALASLAVAVVSVVTHAFG